MIYMTPEEGHEELAPLISQRLMHESTCLLYHGRTSRSGWTHLAPLLAYVCTNTVYIHTWDGALVSAGRLPALVGVFAFCFYSLVTAIWLGQDG